MKVRLGLVMHCRAILSLFSVLTASCAPQDDPHSYACIHAADTPRRQVPDGAFLMGASNFYSEEGPLREVSVASFWIDVHEVTNRQFAAFAEATGYVTVAERAPDPALHPEFPKEQLVAGAAVFEMANSDRMVGHWRFVKGAHWRAPSGPGSDISDRMDYPVVQIAYEDASAYADWVGGDLPTEAEWEFAARGGIDQADYEWGATKPDALATPRANTWQGIFPAINTAADGFLEAAPVGCFEANGLGLHDMTGNVWEWVKDASPNTNQGIVKGGSYLCAENYCRRYRPAARQKQELDFSTNHIGFRVVYRK